jgi:hypothetical protein
MYRLDEAILNFANAPTNRWIFQVALCLKNIKVVLMHSIQAHGESRDRHMGRAEIQLN